MKNANESAEVLLTYLIKRKIATIEEVKTTLRTQSRMTAFRRLSELGYVSSCSHSGKYYSLKRIARYNKYGFWQYDSVLFSKHGTLKNALQALVSGSSKGYTASELNIIIGGKADDVLLELMNSMAVKRKKISGAYVYFSREPNSGRRQELTRNDSIQYRDSSSMHSKISVNELKAALIIFLSTLNEKQRRLYAGIESLKEGHGGDRKIAGLLDIDQRTVAKGRRELLSGEVDVDTNRKKGGGRKQIKKKFQL